MKGRRGRWAPACLVATLALLAAISGIGNEFVYDDLPIILENALVHQLTSAPELWTSGYWPAGLLYRPVAVQLFVLEWAIGAGDPLVFHIVSIVLAMAIALVFFRLASHLLPPLAALAAAALFAVHPVHVEVIANAVGQTELLATGLVLLAVERYIAWRRDGPLSPPRRVALALFALLSILSKETGFVLPLLLVIAEVFVIRPNLGRAWRARHMVSTLVLQGVVVMAAILMRIAALGPTPAAGPAVVFRELTTFDRVVGMLAVVPHWLRLLYWPEHLQAEYGPPALAMTGTVQASHLLGLTLLLGLAGLIAASWRRSPVAAFGAGWVGIAILPVSNLLTPTGVILAERTLFLPSAGAMLVLGAALGGLVTLLDRKPGMRRGVIAVVGGLTVAGALRSFERSLVWRNQEVFFDRLVTDAPTTYRAQLVASVYYFKAGRVRDAEERARRGLALYQNDPQLFEHLGQVLRQQRRCAEAAPILAEGIRRFPDRTVTRSRLIECALQMGDTAAALARAEEAVALGQTEFTQTVRRLSSRR